MTHHPHIHMIVPGAGLSRDGTRWISARPGFLLPVRVLAKLFRRLFLAGLTALHAAAWLAVFGSLSPLAERGAFLRHLAPVRTKRWVVYAKPPFAGPAEVLAYLARYTYPVTRSNRRLSGFDATGVTFRVKDYRREAPERHGTLTLATPEFIRRLLQHVLSKGCHRIRHYGLLASATRRANLACIRDLLAAPPQENSPEPIPPPDRLVPFRCCGGRMRVIERFGRLRQPRGPPPDSAPTGMRST